jgi:hypothetical protein
MQVLSDGITPSGPLKDASSGESRELLIADQGGGRTEEAGAQAHALVPDGEAAAETPQVRQRPQIVVFTWFL